MLDLLTPIDFASRRRRVMDAIGDDAVLVLYANPERRRSNDTFFRYRQSSDMLWLCGFPEPEAVLVLLPGSDHPFTLFVRPRDRERETWDGYRAGPEGAMTVYGADQAFTLQELPVVLPRLLSGRRALYYSLGECESRDAELLRWMKSLRGNRRQGDRQPLAIWDPEPMLHRMRMVKDAAELERMQIAADISAAGHVAAMRATAPGVREYQLEAVLTETFRTSGADGHSYEPIVAGGERACVLHYTENQRTIAAGEMVLVDAGAEFQGYAGDITRTWPVNGVFSGPQRAVYEAVLDAQEFAIAQSVVGATNVGVHEATTRRLVENMLSIGLLSGSLDGVLERGDHREYFMHGTGHYLGLDVHDVGVYTERDGGPFAYVPGMVLTIEPGIYVRPDSDAPEIFRGIGVRIEDNIVIEKNGVTVLTGAAPKSISAIEAKIGTR